MSSVRQCAAIALFLAGCGGKAIDERPVKPTPPGDAGTTATPADAGSPDAQPGAATGPQFDAGPIQEQMAACQRVAEFQLSSCGRGPGLPDDEMQRRAALLKTQCMRQFASAGNGTTAAAFDACTRAEEATRCDRPEWLPVECEGFRGTLEVGANCFSYADCASGVCSFFEMTPTLSPFCGHCRPRVEVAEPCLDPAECVPGAACMPTRPTGRRVCTPYDPPPLSSGEQCDQGVPCDLGLYCDAKDTMRCLPLGHEGAPCPHPSGDGCFSPLHCTKDFICAPPGGPGVSCGDDEDCAPGLACANDTALCTPVRWLEPGEPCGVDEGRCAVSICINRKYDGRGVCGDLRREGDACMNGSSAQDRAADLEMPPCDVGLVCGDETCVRATSDACPN
jgi:hypothetical protein